MNALLQWLAGRRASTRRLTAIAGRRAEQLMEIRLLLDAADVAGVNLRADDVRAVLEGTS